MIQIDHKNGEIYQKSIRAQIRMRLVYDVMTQYEYNAQLET